LKAFGAHISFDDKKEYCDLAAKQVPTGQVFQRIPAKAEVSVRLEHVDALTDQAQFLLVCRAYLKKEYSDSEGEFIEWYDANAKEWPEEIRSVFLEELNASVEGTPGGKERIAAGEENTNKAKLLGFLRKLVHKHRPQ
jgi:hypothetical protein